MNSFKKFEAQLLYTDALVTYSPLPSEIQWNTVPVSWIADVEIITIPQDKDTDPFVYAEELTILLRSRKVCVFIPGTAFDIYGTRHGRGGGWYDRFLSCIPKTWVRVGVIEMNYFTQIPLARQVWDQSVDWVIVHETLTSSWNVYESLHVQN